MYRRDLDLARLIGQVLDPPLRKLGVFDLDTFYPADARRALADAPQRQRRRARAES